MQALLHHHVAGGLLGAAYGVEHRDAGRIHQGEGAGKAREYDFSQDVSHHRQVQFHQVHPVAHRGIGLGSHLQPEPGNERRRDDRPPVVHEKPGNCDQEARLKRDLLAHVLDEADHLRDQVDHEEQGHQHHDGAHESRVHDQLLGLRGELVFPLQRFSQALQHFGQPPGRLARAHQAAKHPAEHVGIIAERL